MAVLASLLPLAEQQFTDGSGEPLAAGSVYFYTPGTTTPKATWADSGQVTLNPNPVTLDANGRAIVYGNGAYRQVVYDAAGNLVWDQVATSPITSDQLSQNSTNPFYLSIGASGGTAIVQAGNAITDSAGQAIVVFPTPFPNLCVSIVPVVTGTNSAPNRYILEVTTPLATTEVAVASTDIITNSFVGNIGFSWIAVGF